MATLILVLCSLYISSATGTEYVIGGYPADIKDFPFQVSMKLNNTHRCGGAVITEKFVITAAHCIFDPIPINQLTIFVGSNKLSGRGQTYAIEHMIYHANFNMKGLLDDIGIIGVKNKIIFSKYVKPIKILKNNLPVGTMLTLTGWGLTSYPNGQASDILQMLQLHVVSLRDCKKALKPDSENIRETNICVFIKMNKGTCKGDSGGPLSLNGLLVGLVSWCSDTGCASGKPDVYTKVSKYMTWIKTTITAYCKTKTCPTKKLYPKFVRVKK